LLRQGNGAAPIAFTDALPLAFEGARTVPNLSLKSVGKPPFDQRQAGILSEMYAGHRLEVAVKDGLELRQQVAQEMADEMRTANRDSINTKGFELEAERMGRLMRDKYRIGFIDVGAWDTHVGEVGPDGGSKHPRFPAGGADGSKARLIRLSGACMTLHPAPGHGTRRSLLDAVAIPLKGNLTPEISRNTWC
jgi:hypothetical protein